MSKLREAARDQPCVRCGREDGTTVGAHYTGPRRLSYGGGLGRKVHDMAMAHLCQACHHYFDTASKDREFRYEVSEEFLHCVVLTAIRNYERGIIK